MFIDVLKFNTVIFILIYIFWYALVILKPRRHTSVNYEHGVDYKHYFLIPCLNEEAVIADTIIFWDKIISNNPNVRIFLIDDASDDMTAKIIEQSIKNKKNYRLIKRTKPNAQTGKGDALNYAYQQVLIEVHDRNLNPENTLITIFDADAIIKKNYLRELEANFSEKNIALVQARVSIINSEKWIGLMQEIDFYTCVDGIQNFRETLKNVGAGGNGQSIRLSSIIEHSDPWGRALLEDFEFSTRLLMQGYVTRYMHREAVYQQGVDKYWPFIRQRARWAQGGIQCLQYRKIILENDYLTKGAKLEMIYFMILPFISLIGIISYILLTLYASVSNNQITMETILVILFFNFITGIIISVKYYWQKKEKFAILSLLKYILVGLTIIIYDWCLVPCQIMAIYRQFRGVSDWVKTAREKVNYEELQS